MRRWYTTFPNGLPGVGLLFLRIAIGVRLIIEGSTYILDPGGLKPAGWALGSLAVGAGTFFVVGFLTPLAAVVSALVGIVVHLWHPAWASFFPDLLSFQSIVMAIAILLLGPGAISLDANFFGRRKIIIPRVVRS